MYFERRETSYSLLCYFRAKTGKQFYNVSDIIQRKIQFQKMYVHNVLVVLVWKTHKPAEAFNSKLLLHSKYNQSLLHTYVNTVNTIHAHLHNVDTLYSDQKCILQPIVYNQPSIYIWLLECTSFHNIIHGFVELSKTQFTKWLYQQ